MTLNNWINPEYLSDKKIKEFQIAFSHNKPFQHLELPNFLKQEKIIALLQALGEQEFSPHHSDLFQFSQTYDLLHSDDSVLKDFAAWLSSPEMLQFMQQITNLKL